jgi:orotate phosphoribosyltransferase
MVGAAVTDRQVLIIDDVITAGTAINEAVSILIKAGGIIVAAMVSLDRQEKVREDTSCSAIQVSHQILHNSQSHIYSR